MSSRTIDVSHTLLANPAPVPTFIAMMETLHNKPTIDTSYTCMDVTLDPLFGKLQQLCDAAVGSDCVFAPVNSPSACASPSS